MSAVEVQPETGELTVLMSEAEAIDITAKIKSYAGVLCSLVKEAHDKQAWRALGYPTWTAYCKAEFSISKSRAYQLIKYAQAIALGADTTGLPESTIVDSLPEGVARHIDPELLKDRLTEAFYSIPDDAEIETRRDLLDAVLEQITADPEPEAPAPSAPPDTTPPPSVSGEPDGTAPSGSTPPGSSVVPDAPGAERGEPDPPPVPPALPDDWRDRIARALYLLGCPIDALRPALTEDDVIELGDLRDYLTDLLDQTEEQQ